MFVLHRYRREGVVLHKKGGDEIIGTVRVLDIQGNRVKLGFEFPESITIDKEESFAALEGDDDGKTDPGGTTSPGEDSLPRLLRRLDQLETGQSEPGWVLEARREIGEAVLRGLCNPTKE